MEPTKDGTLSGTGAEPFLLGWKLAKASRLPAAVKALGGCVLRGYVAAKVAKAKGEDLHEDAALAAWVKEASHG